LLPFKNVAKKAKTLLLAPMGGNILLYTAGRFYNLPAVYKR
jgi:hypothetical protein